jgi:hypothetical protein
MSLNSSMGRPTAPANTSSSNHGKQFNFFNLWLDPPTYVSFSSCFFGKILKNLFYESNAYFSVILPSPPVWTFNESSPCTYVCLLKALHLNIQCLLQHLLKVAYRKEEFVALE